MSIQSQINRIVSGVNSIKSALNSIGTSIPTDTKVDGISTYILGIQTLTNVNVAVQNESSGQVGVFYHTVGGPSCSEYVLNAKDQVTLPVALGSMVVIRLTADTIISLSSGMGGSTAESLSGVAGVYAAPVNAGGTITLENASLLPSGYTQLEYIQSSGNQYINTGFKPNNYTRVVMDIEATSSGTCPFFGGRDSQNATTNSFVLWMIEGTSLRFDYGEQKKTADVNPNGRVQIDANMNICKFGSTTIESESDAFQSSNYLSLFTAISNGVPDERYISAKLYSCKIYDNGQLIRDYIPCKDPSNKYGLYDVVGKKFYGSSGSGSFTGG